MDSRLHVVNWGAGNPRKRTRPANWQEPLKWNAEAADETFAGVKGFHPVFCSSLADVFDNEVDLVWREDLWALIRATPNLTWQLLTKRIGNAKNMLPADWGDGYHNVWLGATIADPDWVPKLFSFVDKYGFYAILTLTIASLVVLLVYQSQHVMAALSATVVDAIFGLAVQWKNPAFGLCLITILCIGLFAAIPKIVRVERC